MADIFYNYDGSAYANLTNKCSCSCSFCIRNNGDSVGGASNLWLDHDPSFEEIMNALSAFGPEKYDELVFCGYGEPTFALDNLIRTAKYLKQHFTIRTRLNTNGQGDIINGRDIVPLIAPYIDAVSISLNAPDRESYEKLCSPVLDGAYDAMLAFTKKCRGAFDDVTMSVVDVIPESDIEKCRAIAAGLGVNFRVRIDV